MASDVECITLDDSDEDTPPSSRAGFYSSPVSAVPGSGRAGFYTSPNPVAGPSSRSMSAAPVVIEEQMVRCNMCVDPGLLPVEEDRAAHRRKVHGNKLFYCYVCTSSEKGGKGFEEFSDVVKHVCRENGLDEKDKKNINDFIRIPSEPDYLKVFKCLFCPGPEGMKFVGLSEERFLEHVLRKHGEKAPRRRPEKLRRECRICSQNFETDTELEQHVNKAHLRDKINPFAAFGPPDSEASEDSDEVSVMSTPKAKKFSKSKKKLYPLVPPAPKSLHQEEKASLSDKLRSWNLETDRFLANVNIPAAYRKQNQHRDSSDDEVDPSASYHYSTKRRKLSGSGRHIDKCLLCGVTKSDMARHLSKHHKNDCFSCNKTGCENLSWLTFKEVKEHIAGCSPHVPIQDGLKLISGKHVTPPHAMESMYCHYCSPPHMIVGDSWDSMREKLFEHMEQHEDIHQGDDNKFRRYTSYCCRLCDKTFSSEQGLDTHMEEHKRKRSVTPRAGSKRHRVSDGRRSALEEGEVRSPSRSRQKRSSYGPSPERFQAPASPDYSPPSSSLVPRQIEVNDKFVCKLCNAKYDEIGHLNRHLQRQHGVPNDPSSLHEVSIYPSDLRRVSCKYCSKTWHGDPEKAILRQHREEHPEMHTSINDCFQRECRACNESFLYNEMTMWMNHITSSHGVKQSTPIPQPAKTMCSYCFEDFNSVSLKKHIVKDHIKESFQCGNCPALFNIRSEAISHMDVEHNVAARQAEHLVVNPQDLRGIICQVCKWNLYGEGNDPMEFHFTVCHQGVPFSPSKVQYFCRICGRDKAFRDLARLEDHIKEHKAAGSRRSNAFVTSINKHLTARVEDDRREGRRDLSRRSDSGRDDGDRRRSDSGRDRERSKDSIRSRDGQRGRDDRRNDDRSYDRRGSDRPRHDDKSKDGDWKCSKCGFDNFASRRECRKCREPQSGSGARGFAERDDRRAGGRDNRGRGRGRGGGRGRGQGGRGDARDGGRGGRSVPWEEDWDCTRCRASNFGRRTDCFKCGAKKGEGKPSEPQISAMDETRSMMDMMFQQLEDQRISINYVIDSLLEEVIDHAEANNNSNLPPSPDHTTLKEMDSNEMSNPPSPDYIPSQEIDTNNLGMSNVDEIIDALIDDIVAGDGCNSSPNLGENTKASDGNTEQVVNSVIEKENEEQDAANNEEIAKPNENNFNVLEDDDYAPASPDYTPLDADDEDTKPNIPQVDEASGQEPDGSKFKCKLCFAKYEVVFDCYVHLQDIHGFSGDDTDVLEENVIQPKSVVQQDLFECSLCQMRSNDMFDVYLHLENKHDIGDDEETLEKHVVKLGSAQAPHDTSNHTVEIDSGDMESDVSNSASESVTNDPSRSSSPIHIETIDQLKEVMKKDKVKFVINDELKDSPEFMEIMHGANNQ